MELNQIIQECQKVAATEGVEITVPIELNSRFRSCLGRVSYEWANMACTKVAPTKIEFSKNYVANASDAQVIQTCIHEVTHYIISVKTGCRHGHDKMFKALNKKLGGDGSRLATVDRAIMKPKYTVYCKTCGAVVDNYYRMCKTVKYPNLYRSNCCNGELRVEQNY